MQVETAKLTTKELCRLSGATRNQLNYAQRKGWVTPEVIERRNWWSEGDLRTLTKLAQERRGAL